MQGPREDETKEGAQGVQEVEETLLHVPGTRLVKAVTDEEAKPPAVLQSSVRQSQGREPGTRCHLL